MLIHSLSKKIYQKIYLGGSKSISNRLLILNALFKNKIELRNLSDAEDTQLLIKALSSTQKIIDIHHAGTAMRFLTSYFSYKKNEKILTGSDRMKQRPIGILVKALRSMGLSIQYLEKEGYPPLKLIPSEFITNKVKIKSNISSQFITSLLLIGSKLSDGLELELIGKITSLPYLDMTINILKELGITVTKNNNLIFIEPKLNFDKKIFIIESDWSSASYYYSIAAISEDCEITLYSLFKNSVQGDQRIVLIYQNYFGINTTYQDNFIILTKIKNFKFPNMIKLNLNDCPDIALTIAVTAAALKIQICLEGLETLKIKETDRIHALNKELKKCGVLDIFITNNTLEIVSFKKILKIPKIKTYNDHRMAMAFTPLSLLYPIEICNEMVVEKSYPNFWKDMNKLGIQ